MAKNKVKNYSLRDGWLHIEFKGFFQKNITDIKVSEISKVEYLSKIIKGLFILGLFLILSGFAGMIMFFTTYIGGPFLIGTAVFILGILVFGASFLFGKKGIFIHTKSGDVTHLPGMKRQDYFVFLSELNLNSALVVKSI